MPSYADEPMQENPRRAAGERRPLLRKEASPASPGGPPEIAGVLNASPRVVHLARLRAMMGHRAAVQLQASLADELNGKPVVQRYEGGPVETLRALLGDLLASRALDGLKSSEAVYRVVYRFYNQGPGAPRTDEIETNIDPVGTLSQMGVPLRDIEQASGFVKISNPVYDADLLSRGLTPQRLSVHVRPEDILAAMLACYHQFGGMPRVSEFKMPSRQDAILNRMDNLVIYFLDDGAETTKGELLDFVSMLGNKSGFVLPEHPPMLAPTGIPGVGSAEGWFSVGDQRSRVIAEAYVDWNKKGGVEGFLQASLKAFQEKGYNPDDLSQAPGEPPKKCFVSTACSRALGLPDDCLELQALRWLRDGHVRRLPSGRRELEAYYDLAPAVVQALDARPDRVQVYTRIYQGLIVPVVTRVLAGDLAGGFRLYKRRVLGLAGTAALAPPLPGVWGEGEGMGISRPRCRR